MSLATYSLYKIARADQPKPELEKSDPGLLARIGQFGTTFEITETGIYYMRLWPTEGAHGEHGFAMGNAIWVE